MAKTENLEHHGGLTTRLQIISRCYARECFKLNVQAKENFPRIQTVEDGIRSMSGKSRQLVTDEPRRLSLRFSLLKFETSGELLIILEESIE